MKQLNTLFQRSARCETAEHCPVSPMTINWWYRFPGLLIDGKNAGLVIERMRDRIPAGAAGDFSSVLILIRCPFHPRVTAVARRRPRSICQKCIWQVTPKHAYTHELPKSEWADYVAVQAYCGNLSGNELTRNLSGYIRPQSSQLAEPLWTDPGIKNGISLQSQAPPPGINTARCVSRPLN